MALPRELVETVFAVCQLKTLQAFDEFSRTLSQGQLADTEYYCNSSFCRALLARRFGLSTAELVTGYDAKLVDGLLLPLELVAKVATNLGQPCYDSHLYFDAKFGLLTALRARDLELINYYLIRYPYHTGGYLAASAVRYYVDLLQGTSPTLEPSEEPADMVASPLALEQRLKEYQVAITESRTTTYIKSLAEQYLLAGDFTRLAELPEFDARVLPLWYEVLPASLVAKLPTLQAVLAKFPDSVEVLYYRNLCEILLGTANLVPLPGSSHLSMYLQELKDLALTVLNAKAYTFYKGLIAQADQQHVSIGHSQFTRAKYTTVSEVAYDPGMVVTEELLSSDFRDMVVTTLFLAGKFPEFMRIAQELPLRFTRNSPIEYELSRVFDYLVNQKPHSGYIELQQTRENLTKAVPRIGTTLVLETLEDIARLLPYLALDIQNRLNVVCCPPSRDMLSLITTIYPEIAATIPKEWRDYWLSNR